jgi:hypothetical protein
MNPTPLKRRYYLGRQSTDIGLAMFVGRGRNTLDENKSFVQEPWKSSLINEMTGWNLETVVMSPRIEVVSAYARAS